MKTPSFLLPIAGLGLVLGACSAAVEPAPADDPPAEEVEVPSEADAEAKAAEEITEENADQELADLENEILGDA